MTRRAMWCNVAVEAGYRLDQISYMIVIALNGHRHDHGSCASSRAATVAVLVCRAGRSRAIQTRG
jgi:hypothetical protein